MKVVAKNEFDRAPKKFCVFRKWKSAYLEEVLEYFHTLPEALAYREKVQKSDRYDIGVGKSE